MFEMVPQSQQDLYFSKLQSGVIKTAINSTADDTIEQEIQTDDLGHQDKFNQAPDDMMINYNRDRTKYQRKKKDQNQALKLEKFIMQAGPVMEKVIEENQANFELNNREAAAKRNAVECK